MKRFVCDICDKDQNLLLDLYDVAPTYCEEDVRHICVDCSNELTELLKILNAEFLSEKIRKIRDKIKSMKTQKRGDSLVEPVKSERSHLSWGGGNGAKQC